MNFKVVTIFPNFFRNALQFSLLKKAQEKSIITIDIYDLRDWAKPREVHKMVDDRPYGGGPGMVMMVEPIYKALRAIKNTDKQSLSVIFSPKGATFQQPVAERFSKHYEELILIAPHYEGFDERILHFVDEEISIGDYILTGGELPSLVVIDAVARLLPGVLGNTCSNKEESFSELSEGHRNLEYPQYTRPEVFVDDEGIEHRVPEVLLSGNHEKIKLFRETSSK